MNFFKKIFTSISLFFSKIFLFFEKNFWKKLNDKTLLKKILFTLSMMVIFVVVGTITLPGINVDNSNDLSTDSFIGILNTIGGGGLRRFSLVSLGISPFITASLIMMFAQTKLIPPLHRLSQSGPAGRIKLNYITHGITFVIGLVQAFIIIQSLTNNTSGSSFSISISAEFDTSWYVWIVLPFILVAGTFFSIFISEQITNKGVGNGTSMLILAGSIITLPTYFSSAWSLWIESKIGEQLFRGIVYFIGFIILFVILMFVISFFYQAERRIPIQQTGVGRAKNIKDLSYLPIKLNPAGVMPVIFASMIISFPMMIVTFVNELSPSIATRWMLNYIQLTSPIGLTIFASSTFALTIFLSLQQAKIDKIVEDFNKVSTFIPGIRPGEQTEDYLISIILRLSIFSAFYLTLLGSSQYIAIILGANPQLVFSGTSVMIIVTVSIETLQQIQARYKALNVVGSKYKKDDQQNTNNNYDEGGSILW